MSEVPTKAALSLPFLSLIVLAVPMMAGLSYCAGGGSSTGGDGVRTGAAVYRDHCAACHRVGRMGAPRRGVEAEWRGRPIDMSALLTSVHDGKGAMPAAGGCPDCTEHELRLAIAYIVGVELPSGDDIN